MLKNLCDHPSKGSGWAGNLEELPLFPLVLSLSKPVLREVEGHEDTFSNLLGGVRYLPGLNTGLPRGCRDRVRITHLDGRCFAEF